MPTAPFLLASKWLRNRNFTALAGCRDSPADGRCGPLTNHRAQHVKRPRPLAAELPPLLFVVAAVEDVPFPAPGDHPLRHASAGQLVQAAVDRERVAQTALRLVQEEALVADLPECVGRDRLQERVRAEREAAL